MMQSADRIRELITAVRRRWFATVAFRTVGTAAAAAAAPAFAAAAVYWALAPQGLPLLVLAAATAILSLAAAAAMAWRIERRPNDRRVARFIEERAEARSGAMPMDDCVVSAVEAMNLPPADPRAPFASLVVSTAVRCLEGVTPADLIARRELRRAALVAAAGAAALAAALVVVSPALGHTIQTARLRLFPQSVTIEVLPGDTRIVSGRPLRIRARIQAAGEELSRLAPALVVSAGSEQRSVPMTRTDDGFEYAFESVDRSFQYKVTTATVSSSQYSVTAISPPRVKRIDIHYQYPAFSNLAPRVERDGGDVYGPAGTRVRLRIEADKPIASGELALSDGRAALTSERAEVVLADLVLEKDDSYRIRLTDRDGLRSDGDSEYFIRLMDDRPPDVRILRPGSDQGITPLEEVAIEARAEDDYGIASLQLVYSVSGGREQVVPFRRVPAGETQQAGSYLLAAEDLKVRPGDVITYYAKARDVGRGKRPTETKTDLFFLEVHPFNAEFQNAQSQASAGAGSGDPQIESLIDAQKEIITATWNVERRSGAGRSADDIKAIAQAQAELKSRAERMMGGARGRRVPEPQMPQQAARPQAGAGADPVASAVEAMTRAVEQLASAKTRDAISHEMAALNALLQAQAEVRRRQVAQQQSNGGGGFGNRQSQDLSALFDKELQRQQRTNYEQRSQIEERPQQAQNENDALDRIRDLARRQEEINRQQRELAGMSAEERKRQLEKLSREQEELQRRAEELAREQSQRGQQGQQSQGQQQSGQQQGGQQQSGQQQGQPQSSSGSGSVRDAAEQMRRAAEEMRRDGQSASASGERAAEQLRRAEQQAQGTSADAKQRAAADLQAEAQQIAQEQRRIAAEAERLERSGDGAGEDARRRLSADKDRLADRVDALQRNAERLGQSGGRGDEQKRAQAAAGELERQAVADKMRQGAEAMRSGKTQPSGKAEQQLARALDQAAEKLGATGSGEAQQMADQLERSRQLRERLDRLEGQMREAQGSGNNAQADKLRQQYEQELRQARQELGRQATASEQRDGTGRSTPEQHEYSRSAPGTEAFKQDRTGWESLRKDVNRALEEHDAAVSQRLAKTLAGDRLSGGASERVPEQYRRLVARYYESLAKQRK